ncbi:hypothetical protein BJV78DRAFT_1173984, partial [Lactifluus subvellereus]
ASNGSTGPVTPVGKSSTIHAALWRARVRHTCTAAAVAIRGRPRSSPLTITTPVSFCFATA